MADVQKELQIVISARDEATRVLNNFKGTLSGARRDIENAGVAIAAMAGGTVLFTKSIVDAAGEMQATRTAFKTLIGDAELANKTLEDLFSLESRTPFTIQSILNESKKLLAMGTNAKDLTKTLEMLGDVAAGVGFEKLPQLTLAFGQIQAKGRLMGTELRQLTEAGFNLAEAMGVSSAQLDQMIADGTVGFEEVRAAFEKVTSEGGRFNGMMENLSKTVPGRLSTLESSVYQLKVALGEALLPAVSQLIEAILPGVQAFAAWAKEHQTLVAIILGAIIVFVSLASIILTVTLAITGFVAVLGALSGAFSVVAGIIGAVVALLGGPVTIVILAVMALIGLFTAAWVNNWGDIQGKTKAFTEWFSNNAWPVIKQVFGYITDGVNRVAQNWIDRFGAIKNTVEGIIGAIRSVISAAENMASRVKGGLKIPGFQHGGFIPGSYNTAVPAVLHGGERVIPRNGTDVNPGMYGGSAPSVSININGSFNLDSPDRVEELANKIISILGRQNELAGKGMSI